MSSQDLLWQYLWIGPHVLLLGVAAAMFRNSRYRNFPIFFTYLVFESLQFWVLFGLYLRKLPIQTYTNVDLLLRAGSSALHFGVLQELFESPLTNDASLRRVTAPILRWITALLVLLAAVFIASIYYHIPGQRLLQPYLSVEAFNVAQCGLLVLVFCWHRYLRVRIAHFALGVMLGLGLVAGSEPLIHVWREYVSNQNSKIVDCVQMGVFHVAVLVWLCFALASDAAGGVISSLCVPQGAEGIERIAQL